MNKNVMARVHKPKMNVEWDRPLQYDDDDRDDDGNGERESSSLRPWTILNWN